MGGDFSGFAGRVHDAWDFACALGCTVKASRYLNPKAETLNPKL